MNGISAWAGSGAGLIAIGVCVIASWFLHRMPRFAHPWLHRAFIVLQYSAAAALTITPMGTWAIRAEQTVLGWFGGTSAGLGHAALVLGAWFLLLTVAIALIWAPGVTEGYLAIGLVFTLVLLPSGALHSVYAATAVPGQHLAASIAMAIGG